MIEITTDIIRDFRLKQPAFSDTGEWPNPVLISALEEADSETGSSRWGQYENRSNKQRGMFFYAAHWLAISYPKKARDNSRVNASPSLTVSSKSIGDESVSYAVPASANETAAWLNTTNYGQQFLKLKKRISVGAMVV